MSMSDPSDKFGDDNSRSGNTSRPDNEFFTVGPPLHAVRAGYVERRADRELYDAIAAGSDAYLFAPMRIGKTSLIAATAAKLRNNGFQVAILDLAQIGERDAADDPGRWYYSIAYRLLRQLRIKVDLQEWWQDKSILPNRQRLFEFYLEVLLGHTREPVVIVIDELQAIEGHAFASQLVESITAANKARVTDPELGRLSFVLSGECDSATLVANPELSPFGMMQRIQLQNFQREDLQAFAPELNLDSTSATLALDRIYYWTDGQPYLVQKIGRMIAREGVTNDVVETVDRLVRQQFASRASVRNEPHLAHIHRRIVSDRKLAEPCLTVYGRLRKGISVDYEPESKAQRLLVSLGLVRPDAEVALDIASPLLSAAFTTRWANEHLPLRWRGPATAVGVLLLLCAVPFWYTQLLPQPFARILTSPSVELDTAAEAYRDLRSFPGHGEAAERLFAGFIRMRASAAANEAEVAAIAALAANLSDQGDLSRELVADFWDRRLQDRQRLEDRDGALIASLQSLVSATPERRRTAGSLIGDDYPLLIGGVPIAEADAAVFDPFNQVLTATRGADVSQWVLQAGRIEARSGWTATALEVLPLLRRVVADSSGSISSLSLSVRIDHGRPDDLRLRLIAPSGRSVEVTLGDSPADPNAAIQIPRGQLLPLRGEPVEGTWTLSLRDDAMDVSGELQGWQLSINGQTINDSFDAPIFIPAPVERPSDATWLSDDGRYAVARARQSDSVRLWNLSYASPIQTLAVPFSEQIFGVSAAGDWIVSRAGSTLHGWEVASGERLWTFDLADAEELRWLPNDNLLVRRDSDDGAEFEVYDLMTRQRRSALSVGGDAAMFAIDDRGESLAVADYDGAVRLWRFGEGEPVAQFDLPAQPQRILLGPDGRTLVAQYGDGGISLWRGDRPERPLLERSGSGNWGVAFSAAGDRLIAGNDRAGYQIYRSSDGRSIGPPLDAGRLPPTTAILAFSDDGNTVLTGGAGFQARFWRFPTAASALTPTSIQAAGSGRWWWRNSEDRVARLSPDGSRVAVGDADGHVHLFGEGDPVSVDGRDLGFLGHLRAVVDLSFSDDGQLAASVGREGSVRVWDAQTGLPRGFAAASGSASIDQLRFSPSGRYLAALADRRFWLMATATGEFAADIDLGEQHVDFDFRGDDSVFVASASGALRELRTDRIGSWVLSTVFQGEQPWTKVRAGRERGKLLLVDSLNVAQVYDLGTSALSPITLQLPDRVTEVRLIASDGQVLLRTTRWVHRAVVSANGLHWQSAVRIPQPMPGSTIAVDESSPAGPGLQLSLLTRDGGFAEIAEIDFFATHAAPVPGDHTELLTQWRQRLGPVAPSTSFTHSGRAPIAP